MEIAKARYRYNAKPPHKRRSKRVASWIMGFVLFLSLGSYSTLALTKSVPTLSAESGSFETAVAEKVQLPWPTAGQAAIGSVEEGLLVTSGDTELQKPIASMTKIVTSLVMLEQYPLQPGEQGKTYTMTAADVAIYRNYVAKFGSVMPVREGQRLTQYQALEAILLPSANNVADSFILKLFGTMDAYLDYANQQLKSWGLDNTVVQDASGFSPGSMSTPSDMIKIGQLALKNPVVAEIIQKRTAQIPDVGTIRNTNMLLQDENVVGIKTGTTDEAGSCLLFAVTHGPDNDKTMIGVVMGQPNWTTTYRVVRTLRDEALKNFGIVEVLTAGTVVGTYKTSWGQSTKVVTAEPLSVYGWRGSEHQAVVTLDDADSPLSAGQVVGTASLADGGANVPVVATSAVTPPSIWWRLANYW